MKPFFGLGLNSGFEDISVLDQCLEDCDSDLSKALPLYTRPGDRALPLNLLQASCRGGEMPRAVPEAFRSGRFLGFAACRCLILTAHHAYCTSSCFYSLYTIIFYMAASQNDLVWITYGSTKRSIPRSIPAIHTRDIQRDPYPAIHTL